MIFELPLARLTCVAFDLESTGVAPGYDAIIELAAVRFRVDPTGRVEPGPVLDRLVDPGREIPVPTTRLTGISDAMVHGASPLPRIWDELEAFLDAIDGPVVMMAHNVRADLSFLVACGDRIGRRWRGPPVVCSLDIARRTLLDAPRYRLRELVKWLGCADGEAVFHRAAPDALHTRNLFARCVGRTGARTLAELGARGPVRVPSPEEFEVSVPPRLEPLVTAMERSQRVRIVYRGGSKGREPRPVTPLSFYCSEGVLFLRGWCHVDDVAKSFRCDRIKQFRT